MFGSTRHDWRIIACSHTSVGKRLAWTEMEAQARPVPERRQPQPHFFYTWKHSYIVVSTPVSSLPAARLTLSTTNPCYEALAVLSSTVIKLVQGGLPVTFVVPPYVFGHPQPSLDIACLQAVNRFSCLLRQTRRGIISTMVYSACYLPSFSSRLLPTSGKFERKC